MNQQTYKFSNNGKHFEITIGGYSGKDGISIYDGNLTVFDDDIVSVDLLTKENTMGLIFKRKITTYSILIKYNLGGFNKSEYSKIIAVAQNEVELAKKVCVEATNVLYRLRKAKETYEREQKEKLEKARKEDTIDAIDLNGNTIKIWRRETFFCDIVLVADEGTAYHTHADCFENWKPMYRRNFTSWQFVKKTDAEKQGLHECKLCEKYYEVDDDDPVDYEDEDY